MRAQYLVPATTASLREHLNYLTRARDGPILTHCLPAHSTSPPRARSPVSSGEERGGCEQCALGCAAAQRRAGVALARYVASAAAWGEGNVRVGWDYGRVRSGSSAVGFSFRGAEMAQAADLRA